MRKISLLSLLVATVAIANAQWTKVNVPHNDLSLLYDVEVPNINTVWASEWVSLNGGASFSYTNEFLRTADAGITWNKAAIQSPNGYAVSNLSPIDADTCYASMYNSNGGGGGIFKTTDGGSTWQQLSEGLIFNSSSFPDIVYFSSPKDGLAIGDANGPGDPYLEIYTTTDYGGTWVRVPRENLPPTSQSAAGITNSYCVSGNRIWFQVIEGDFTTGAQFIYRSDDKGLHWKAFPLDMPTHLTDFVFTDELNGVAVGIDNQVPYLYRTSNGGETWDGPVSYSGPLMAQAIAAVPGTSTLVSTNAIDYGPVGSAYSYDLGNTWTTIDTGRIALHSDVKFFNSTTGWSGQFKIFSSHDGGMFQWSGTILPVTFSSFTASKATQSLVLNWQTAQESNNAYFAVERSVNGTNFAEIGKVNSKGTSTQPQQYGYEDFGFAKGQNYYRLKQVNTDGKFAYSAVLSIEFTGTQFVRMYPNPVKNMLHVDGLSNTAATTISIVNNAGTVVQKITTTGSTYTFNLQLLPAGNYYLKLENNKKVTTMKFIKQ